MKAGWGIEISSKEKKRKFDAAITFPAIQMINAPGKDPGIVQNEKPDFKNDIDLYKLNLQTVKTTGFVSANGDIPLLTNDKINIGVGADSTQEIIFEIAIPFKELFPANNAEMKEELTLGVTVNALKDLLIMETRMAGVHLVVVVVAAEWAEEVGWQDGWWKKGRRWLRRYKKFRGFD